MYCFFFYLRPVIIFYFRFYTITNLANNYFCEQLICQFKDSFGWTSSLSTQLECSFFFSYALTIVLLFNHGDQNYSFVMSESSFVLQFCLIKPPIQSKTIFCLNADLMYSQWILEKDKDWTHTSAGTKSVFLALSLFLSLSLSLITTDQMLVLSQVAKLDRHWFKTVREYREMEADKSELEDQT